MEICAITDDSRITSDVLEISMMGSGLGDSVGDDVGDLLGDTVGIAVGD